MPEEETMEVADSAVSDFSSYSKLMAFEAARILHRIGCDVKVYDSLGLPVKDDVHHDHKKVQELRQLSLWSDGQFWCSPEQHGNLTAVLKNQGQPKNRVAAYLPG
jgi:arsenic resistance protein ArsH